MIHITLPDGSRREYPGPVTVADMAQSIGPGLAKMTVAGKVDGKARRRQRCHRSRRQAAIITAKDPTAWR
jgi:threonyl-tRNA synthetase